MNDKEQYQQLVQNCIQSVLHSGEILNQTDDYRHGWCDALESVLNLLQKEESGIAQRMGKEYWEYWNCLD